MTVSTERIEQVLLGGEAPPLRSVTATRSGGARWLTHFRDNRQARTEPDWAAPITLAPAVIRPLVRSLEQFELGDGGGPGRLIAWNAAKFYQRTPLRQALVDHWFVEEKEHSRLVGGLVRRFGGRPIRSHWSFSAFCGVRRWLGVSFELTVLLLTEISSTAYYRLLQRHADDTAVRGVCRLILRDEAGHIAFHRDRIARDGAARFDWLWERGFRFLGLAAATMLWVNHARALRAIGATLAEFFGAVNQELDRFLRQLRSEAAIYGP